MLKQTKSVLILSGLILNACSVPRAEDTRKPYASKVSSVTMQMPDALKAYVGDDKINAYSLSFVPGTCESGVVGKQISKVAQKLDMTSGKLAEEKLIRGCAYTLTLSLGKLDSTGQKLEKIYLSNDKDGKRTAIESAQTKQDKIKVQTTLYVTAAGKADLKIEGQEIEIQSSNESDVDIGVNIGQTSTSLKFSDVSAIVANNCSTCHNGSGLFSLKTREDFVAKKGLPLEEISSGAMPVGKPDFKNTNDGKLLIKWLQGSQLE